MDGPIETACSHCGATNRIPKSRIGDDPRCGKCKESVFPDHPIVTSDATWKREVEESPIPVLVDFWAPWCGPCRSVAPVLEKIALERKGTLKIVKLNVDENPRTSAAHQVQSIPMLLLQRGPKAIDKVVGAMAKGALDSWIDRHL